QVGAGGLGHVLAGGLAGVRVCTHGGHDLVPGAGQRLVQLGVVGQGCAVNHHHVDYLAGYFVGVEHLCHARGCLDLGQQRVPGGYRLHVAGGEGGDHVGVRRVHDLEVLLGQAGALQAAGQQVVGDRQLDQVDVHAPEVAQGLLLALDDDAVVAVGEVADDQRRAVHAAGGGDGQGVHVGHGAAVELAGGVLVDRLRSEER